MITIILKKNNNKLKLLSFILVIIMLFQSISLPVYSVSISTLSMDVYDTEEFYTAFNNGYDITLNQNITLSQPLYPQSDIAIDLNGYSLTVNGYIFVTDAYSLRIFDGQNTSFENSQRGRLSVYPTAKQNDVYGSGVSAINGKVQLENIYVSATGQDANEITEQQHYYGGNGISGNVNVSNCNITCRGGKGSNGGNGISGIIVGTNSIITAVGGNGDPNGGIGISGNIDIDNCELTATGGCGKDGKDFNPFDGGNGGDGIKADGSIKNSTILATGGNGGRGSASKEMDYFLNKYVYGKGGNGGNGISGTLTIINCDGTYTGGEGGLDGDRTGYSVDGVHFSYKKSGVDGFGLNPKSKIVFNEAYTVELYSNGGKFSDNSDMYTKSVERGTTLYTLSIPKKEHYKFVGWSTDVGGINMVELPLTIIENICLYAQWEIEQFTVTFNTDGGLEIPPQIVEYGELLNMPISPVKNGYKFVGWFTDANFNTQVSFPCTITTNTTIYAKWERSTDVYSVIFDYNDGENTVVKNVFAFSKLNAPLEPQKEGYYFLGWFTDRENGEKITFPYTVDDNITFYAHYTKYRLMYDANGGDEAPIPYLISNEKEIKLSDIRPNRNGYKFVGWSSDKDSQTAEYLPGDIYQLSNGLVLYAVWNDLIKLSVTPSAPIYVVPDGIVRNYDYKDKRVNFTVESIGEENTGELTIGLSNYEDFWIYGQDGKSSYLDSKITISGLSIGEQYNFSVEISSVLPVGCHQTEISIRNQNGLLFQSTIQFTVIQKPICNVTLSTSKGGTVSGAGEYKYGDYVSLKCLTCDEGYFFVGFFDENGNQVKMSGYPNRYGFYITEDRCFEARFSRDYCSLNVKTGAGGSVLGVVGVSGIIGKQQYDIVGDTEIELKAIPNEGYEFDGWYEDDKIISSDVDYSFLIKSRTRIEARFRFVPKQMFYINDEVIIEIEEDIIPQGAAFHVEKIVPPPTNIVDKVKEKCGDSSEVISYYTISLIDKDGLQISKLCGNIKISIIIPEKYRNGYYIEIYQEDIDGNLIKMDSTIKNGYISYSTNWLEIY